MHRLLLVGAAAALLLPGSGVADVLVLQDGSRVETNGPWEVKGASVVFKLATGTLGSLRLKEVDLDASAVATAEAVAPKPSAQETRPQPRAAVLTLTDEDVSKAPADVLARQAAGPSAGEAEEEVSPDAGGRAEKPSTIHVTVDSWEQSYDVDASGVRVTGVLKNNGREPVSSISLTVDVYDQNGKLLASNPARVGAVALGPGRTVGFSASFPSIGVVNDVKFKIDHDVLMFEKDFAPAPVPEGEEGA